MNLKLAKKLRGLARASTPGLPERGLDYVPKRHRLENDLSTTRGMYRLLKRQARVPGTWSR